MLKPFYFAFLLLFYLKEIMVSGLFIARIILSRKELNEGVFTMETTLKKPRQVIFLFNLISMTPGTLSIDLYDNNSKLDIHVLDINETESIHKNIKKLEFLILKCL